MKSFFAILFLGFFLCVNAVGLTNSIHKLDFHQLGNKASLCLGCNSFINAGINQLLNTILQSGIIGGCSELCSKAFPTEKSEQSICNLVCDSVGVMTFMKLVKQFQGDLDSIYFCQLAHVCPVREGSKARLDSISVSPQVGHQGTPFEIDVVFTVLNQTSTGELQIQISPPKSTTIMDGSIDEGFAPGQYSVKFQLDTHPTEQESFESGLYQVQFLACDGECGSKFPHTALLFTGLTNFTIQS